MIDGHGRRIHKLRISVTDHCQFRCLYCLPEQTCFTSENQFLNFAEIMQLIPAFVAMGVDTVRLTGGEPLLRANLPDLVRQLKVQQLQVGLTTNGQLLKKFAGELKQVGLDSLNISLDALEPQIFKQLSGFDGLAQVLDAIDMALAMGLPVKINTVVLRGINDQQIIPLLRYAQGHGVEVRFLELMKIGPLRYKHETYFFSADQMVQEIEAEFGTLKRLATTLDSTAMRYGNERIQKLGIIASESYPFCGNCSRLRLTATGKLYGCMMQTQGIDLKAYLRWTPQQIPSAIAEAIALKPLERIPISAQHMHVLGG